jgi:CheY-like chemotaxis protein
MFDSTLDISVAHPAESTLSGRSLLIVDDDHGIRAVLCWILENAGAQVTPAASGEDALDRMREKAFDLILLDINMPGMGGLEALDCIVQTYPQTRVIMLSADTTWNLNMATDRGACGFLRKPFRVRELLEIVEHGM